MFLKGRKAVALTLLDIVLHNCVDHLQSTQWLIGLDGNLQCLAIILVPKLIGKLLVEQDCVSFLGTLFILFLLSSVFPDGNLGIGTSTYHFRSVGMDVQGPYFAGVSI